jgi:cell division protein FtsA
MPLDMIGVRLEAEVHIITCSITGAQNLIKCVNRAGFRANGLILQTLAAGRAVLTEEEKELGVILLDLGGGTTDILVYSQGTPHSTATIPVGGSQVTSDISILKNLSFETSEKIKLEAGCCWEDLLESDEEILVPGVGGRAPVAIPRSHIEKIIRPRMEEIFTMVYDKLDGLALSRPPGGGVVLTGGGAQMPGAAELAARVFNLPVRIGSPLMAGGLAEEYRSPGFATAVGLMLEGYDREERKISGQGGGKAGDKGQGSLLSRITGWIKNELF